MSRSFVRVFCIVRMPHVYTRMHAARVTDTLGAGAGIGAVAAHATTGSSRLPLGSREASLRLLGEGISAEALASACGVLPSLDAVENGRKWGGHAMCREFGLVRPLQGSCACADRCKRNASSRLVPVTFSFVGLTLAVMLLVATGVPALAAASPGSPEPLYLLGIPVDFILFALTLLGVALFHHHTLQVALTGLAAIVVYKLGFTGFKSGPGLDRPRPAHAARVGDPHQPVPAADGLRAAVAAFREEQAARRDAGLSARRLEGRVRAAGDRVRAVELPRQHRGRADRRRDGARRCSGARCTSAISPPSSRPPTPAAPAAWSATPPPP